MHGYTYMHACTFRGLTVRMCTCVCVHVCVCAYRIQTQVWSREALLNASEALTLLNYVILTLLNFTNTGVESRGVAQRLRQEALTLLNYVILTLLNFTNTGVESRGAAQRLRQEALTLLNYVILTSLNFTNTGVESRGAAQRLRQLWALQSLPPEGRAQADRVAANARVSRVDGGTHAQKYAR